MRTIQLLALCSLLVRLEAPSLAAEPPTAAKAIATRLFDDAASLFENGKFAKACDMFAESQRLDPQLGTLVYLADCYAKIGKTASAWALFQEAVEIATARGDDRLKSAQARVAELEPKVCKLTIAVAPGGPEGLAITSNGSPVGKVLLGSPMPVDPGEYRIVAKADGFEDWATKAVITPDTLSTLVVIPPLAEKASDAAARAQSLSNLRPGKSAEQTTPVPTQPHTDSRSLRRSLGYVLGAVGVIGIGVGVGFGFAKEAKQSERDSANACSATSSCTVLDENKVNQLTNEARTRATVANVGFIAGGAAIAAGAILVATAWPKSAPSASAQVQPWLGDKTAGLTAGVTW